MTRPAYLEAIRRSRVLEVLAGFDPHIAGTPPLGLDLPDSDIDILCHCAEPDALADLLWSAYRDADGFSIRQWVGRDRAIVSGFEMHGWPFEIFGQAVAVAEQAGWRHFVIERRLLAMGGSALRSAIMRARRAGMKTEPGFAAVLGLTGDPYLAMLDLESLSGEDLAAVIRRAGFDPVLRRAASPAERSPCR